MSSLELLVERDTFSKGSADIEGFCLGKIYSDNLYFGETLEDEDRRLEEVGKNGKVYGRTAIPCGRYEIVLYNSPRHGVVPLLLNVPTHEYVEIHGANHSNELLGCIAVGRVRTADGVAKCSVVVNRIVDAIQNAIDSGRKCYITVRRKE